MYLLSRSTQGNLNVSLSLSLPLYESPADRSLTLFFPPPFSLATVWWQIREEAEVSSSSMSHEGQVEGSTKDSGNTSTKVASIQSQAVVPLTQLFFFLSSLSFFLLVILPASHTHTHFLSLCLSLCSLVLHCKLRH